MGERVSFGIHCRLAETIKTYRPKLSSLLSDGTGDGGTLHLTLGVDDDTSVVLEVQEDTVGALPGLGLSDNDGRVDLLAELGLSLLDGGHDHVANTAGGQSVQAGTDTLDGDDVQVTGTRVVGAVHDGTTVVENLLVHDLLKKNVACCVVGIGIFGDCCHFVFWKK